MPISSVWRKRIRLLARLPENVIADVLRDRITLNPGAPALVRTMRERGAYAAVVSGGFRQFTAAARDRAGADEDRANAPAIRGGKLSGEVIEPILGRDAKLGALHAISAERASRSARPSRSATGASDFAMLKAAGLDVGYRAKPKVPASADARVDHADLTALPYAPGIARSELWRGDPFSLWEKVARSAG
jgi:phosphoserine phosphatase